jgi:CbiX
MKQLTFLVVSLRLIVTAKSFLMSQSSRPHNSRKFTAESEEPDLLEYFDPLLSPHAYPNGISPDMKPARNQVVGSESSIDPLGTAGTTSFISALAIDGSTSPRHVAPPVVQPDVFDPLLSPHMYPNGTPENVIEDLSLAVIPNVLPRETFEIVGSSDFVPLFPSFSRFDISPSPTSQTPSIDPEFFDPLLSPHAYANGTPDNVLVDPYSEKAQQAQQRQTFEPLDANDVFSLLSSVSVAEYSITSSPAAPQAPDVFDPLLSPHMYPSGTPDRVVGDPPPMTNKRRIGILLMDHGSRNQGSNDRLHEVARLYQESVDQEQFVVAAAHMELASPTIPEGLKTLLDQGVEEVVCHPYFLSAQGRHVSEDIPEIINGAIDSLKIDIPVVITPPVGSQTDIMIAAIQSLVKQSSRVGF